MPALRSLYVDVESRHESAIAGLREVDEAGDAAASSLGEAEEATDRLERRQRALKTALVGTAAVAGGAALALREIAQVGMEVDQTLSIVEATSGATQAEMEAIRGEAARLGAEMPLTMSEIADGFRELSYAGFSAEESVAAMAGVANLAVAGMLDLGQASQIVSDALNQFNLEADQAGAVADGMAATFASSATTIEDLGQALGYVGGVASAAGQDITEINAVLGTLADNGLRGSRAGTALQQVLSSIASPSTAAADALASIGLSAQSFTDEAGNFRDMSEIVQILAERLEGMPEQERLAFLTEVFGERGARAMAPLIENVEDLNQKLQTVAGADIAGSLDELATLGEEQLAERMEGLQVEITPEMDREAMLAQFVSLRDDLSEEEITAEIQTTLNVDERAAELLAQQIQAGADASDLAAALDDVVTAGDLTAAQMNTLAGQLEYVRGSMQAFMYGAYGAIEPALTTIFGGLVNLVDLLNAHPGTAKAFGAALLAIAAGAGLATVAIGGMIVETKLALITATAAGQQGYFYAASQRAVAAASRVAAVSQLGLRGALAAAAGGFRMAALSARAFLASLGPLGWALIAAGAILSAYMADLGATREIVDGILGPVADFAGYLWGLTDALGGVADYLGEVVTGGLEPFLWAGGLALDVARYLGDWLVWAGEAAGILLGALDIPIIAGAAAAMGDLAGAVGWVFDALQPLLSAGLTVVLGGIAIQAASAAAGMVSLSGAAGLASGVVGTLGGVASAAAGGLGLLSTGLRVAAMASRGLMAALGPVGWVILAVGAAFAAYQSNLFGFKDIVDGVIGSLADLAGRVLPAVTRAVELLLSPVDLVKWYLDWLNQGGLLSPLLGDFKFTESAVWDLLSPVDLVRGYLEWLNQGGILGPLLGDFRLTESAVWDLLVPIQQVIDALQTVGRLIDRVLPDIDLPDLPDMPEFGRGGAETPEEQGEQVAQVAGAEVDAPTDQAYGAGQQTAQAYQQGIGDTPAPQVAQAAGIDPRTGEAYEAGQQTAGAYREGVEGVSPTLPLPRTPEMDMAADAQRAQFIDTGGLAAVPAPDQPPAPEQPPAPAQPPAPEALPAADAAAPPETVGVDQLEVGLTPGDIEPAQPPAPEQAPAPDAPPAPEAPPQPAAPPIPAAPEAAAAGGPAAGVGVGETAAAVAAGVEAGTTAMGGPGPGPGPPALERPPPPDAAPPLGQQRVLPAGDSPFTMPEAETMPSAVPPETDMAAAVATGVEDGAAAMVPPEVDRYARPPPAAAARAPGPAPAHGPEPGGEPAAGRPADRGPPDAPQQISVEMDNTFEFTVEDMSRFLTDEELERRLNAMSRKLRNRMESDLQAVFDPAAQAQLRS